jgi:hypothetical protein
LRSLSSSESPGVGALRLHDGFAIQRLFVRQDFEPSSGEVEMRGNVAWPARLIEPLDRIANELRSVCDRVSA